MISLSPKKTFLHISKRLLEHGDTYYSLEGARLTADRIVDNLSVFDLATVNIPSVDDEGNLVFAVGEFDTEKGCYPMHMDFIEGHLVPVYGLDKCVVSRICGSFFASLEYTRKLLNAPELTEHQLKLIVEEASNSSDGEEFMTDYLLKNAYHRMVRGFIIYGREEEDDKWNINVKRLTSESVNPVLVDSCTVSSREELIDKVKECLGHDRQDVYNFLKNSNAGEIHTPDMVIMYKSVGSNRKMYIDPKCGKYVTESI